VSVSRDSAHRFSKPIVDAVTLVAGLGIKGDAHFGTTAQHLSRMRRDPTQPNPCQVHLMRSELFDEVAASGHEVSPGAMAIVMAGGVVRAGDSIDVRLPAEPYAALEPV
jgi:hypothetical protein